MTLPNSGAEPEVGLAAPISPAVLSRALDSATMIDTRDRVVDLRARFDALEHKVAKNVEMIEDLHAAYLQAQGASKTAAFIAGILRLALAGSAGAAGWAWLAGHWPKL